MVGEKVTINKSALTEDQQIFPHGIITSIVDDHTVLVELEYLEETVQVDIKFVKFKDKSKKR